MSGNVDLHVHTTASDGIFSPAAIVELAERINLTAVAITDHDTTAGVGEAVEAGENCQVEVVSGVELSVRGENLGALHIVGLWVNGEHPDLKGRLQDMVSGRQQRAGRIIRRLEELGCPVDRAEVEHFAGGDVVGRPHVARALVKRGYVESMDEAFERFLRRGKEAYMDRERMTAEEAIALIRRAGGVAVLAHPGIIRVSAEKFESELTSLCKKGLGGMEVFYPEHTPTDVERLHALCRKFDLAPSGGTDFHGYVNSQVELGGVGAPEELMESLREKISS